jgi:hypothetical protein
VLGEDYIRQIEDWRRAQDAEIRRERGPLSLVGLYWLQNGVNTVGSSRDCAICLPKPAPRLLGAFDLDGRKLTFRSDIGQQVEVDSKPIQGTAVAPVHLEDSPSLIRAGDIAMAPIQHAGKLGLQVWYGARPGLAEYPPRAWYPLNQAYSLSATYTPYPTPVTLQMPDSLGSTQAGYAQGYVSFKLEGKSYNLDATENEDGTLFLQFRDRTNGDGTFSEGRFLNTGPVSEDGRLSLDFNRAFNPIAAFSAFASCALPPKKHLLDHAIEAGEREAPRLPALA